jgi:DNA-binding response OmpR family regulator
MSTAAVPCVLVVESEVLVRLAVAAYLRECGFKVLEVSAADEAQRVLQSDVAADVVLCEVNGQGELDGFGLAQWLRRERPQVKVILTSGVRRTAKEAGALCEDGPHLTKPYDHRNLERRIRQLLARES